MSRVPSLLVSASFLAAISFLALSPTPALAASAAEVDCLSQPNSTFDKATKSCNTTTTENVGKSPKSQTFTEETVTDYNSSPNNPHNETSTDCADGVGNSNNCH